AYVSLWTVLFFFQAEDGIRDFHVTGVQTYALPISPARSSPRRYGRASAGPPPPFFPRTRHRRAGSSPRPGSSAAASGRALPFPRWEERRVGKERRSRGSSPREKKTRVE